MTLGEKLKKIRKDNGLSMDTLTERLNRNHGLNISKSMVSRWENDHASPVGTFVAAYAKEFDVDMNYLVGIRDEAIVELSDNVVKIPVLGSVPAGVPVDAVENILEYIELDAATASRGNFYALVIKGDSMLPDLRDQDIVIFRKQDYIESGEIAIVYVNGYEATCKKVIITETGVILQPINPAYPPQAFTYVEMENTPVRIVGKVFESRRRF